jgi:hypothetical protein
MEFPQDSLKAFELCQLLLIIYGEAYAIDNADFSKDSKFNNSLRKYIDQNSNVQNELKELSILDAVKRTQNK